MKPEPKYVAETLAWCNEQRKERGKRPLKKMPRGVKDDVASCPCGKAAGVDVYTSSYYERDGTTALPLPRPVQRFVAAFDKGRLPQYEEKPSA